MMLTYDARRAFSIRWIYLSIAAMVLLALLTRLDTIAGIIRDGKALEQDWTINFIYDTLTGDTMLFCLPVLCTLPFSASFIDEYKSGILRFSLGRVKRRTWLISKVTATALSGGLVLVVGALGLYVAAFLVFSGLEAPAGASMGASSQAQVTEADPSAGTAGASGGSGAAAGTSGSSGGFGAAAGTSGVSGASTGAAGTSGAGASAARIWLAVSVRLLARYFCFGALGAVTGLWISTAINNRYMAWLSPFMAEYLLIIFCERYFTGCNLLYPKQWLDPSEIWPADTWSVCLWLLALTAFASWAFVESARRRLMYV